MSELRGKVVSSLRWQAAAKLGSQLISWGVTIFVMRLLAPADYGLMAMCMVLVGLSALIAEMGLGAALVRAPEAHADLQRRVFGLSLGINGLLYAALLLSIPLIVAVFQEPRLAVLTAVMGLQLPLAALAVVPDAMARRELQFKTLSLIELAVQTGSALSTLACAWAGWGVWSLVVGHLAGTGLKALLLLIRFGSPLPRWVWRGQRELLGFGSSLTLNRVVWYFSGQADVFIAGRLLGQQLLGVYAVAVNLATMPMQKLMQVANQVAFSAFAKLQDQPAQRNAALLRSTTLMSALSIALLWGLASTAPELIELLLGAKWQAAVIPLQLIALVVPIRIIAALMSTALVACGHVHDDLRNTLLGAAILIPAFWIGTQFGGLHGLALAWAIGYPLYGLLLIRRACQRFELGLGRLLMRMATPVSAGLAMVGSIELLRRLDLIQALGLQLAVHIGVGALSYLLVLQLLDRSLLPEAKAFLRGGKS